MPADRNEADNKKRKSWKSIYEELRALVEERKLPGGAPCPSENELCRQYGVSRGTVRSALSQLFKEGYLDLRPGKVRVVRRPDPLPLLRFSPDRSQLDDLSFGKQLLTQADTQGWRKDLSPFDEVLQRPEKVPWYGIRGEPRLEVAVIKEKLRLEGEDLVFWFLRARYAKGNPIVLQWTVVPARYLAGRPVSIEDLRPGGVTDLYHANGIHRRRVLASYRPTVAMREEARSLHIERGTPLIEEQRISMFLDSHATEHRYEFLVTLYTDRATLGFQWEDRDADREAGQPSGAGPARRGRSAGRPNRRRAASRGKRNRGPDTSPSERDAQ